MLGAPLRPCGSVVAWRRADRTAEFSSLLSRRKSAGNRFSCCSLVPSDYWETVLVRVLRFSSLHIPCGDTTRSFPPSPSTASHRGSSSFHIDSAKDTSRHPIAFHRSGDTAVYTAIQRVSHRGNQPSFLLTLSSFVALFTAKLALPRRSSDTQRCHSPIPTGGESISSVPTRSSVQLLPVGVWLAWNGFAPFSPSSSPQSPLVDAASALVLPCGRATAPPIIRSPVHLPRHLRPAPQVHSRPSSSISRSRPCTYCTHSCAHATAYLTNPEWPAVHFAGYPPQGKAYPDPEWSSRSSSLAIRCQEGVSAPRVVQAFIVTRYPPPRRRIRTPSGPAVHLHSLPAARKAYPDPGWSSRSSSLAVRLQEGVSGPRVVHSFIFTRYPPPGRRIRTPSGPSVHLHPLSAARKAYPDHERSRRLSSLAIRCQEGVSGPRVVQPFIFTRYSSIVVGGSSALPSKVRSNPPTTILLSI